MRDIIGELCANKEELKRTASKRKKSYEEKTVEHTEVESYKEDGWEVLRTGKSKTRIKKPKPTDILFEDRVWMIFYNLGFRDMNKDRKCKLEYGPYTKQIDVLARDDEMDFPRNSGHTERLGYNTTLGGVKCKRKEGTGNTTSSLRKKQ